MASRDNLRFKKLTFHSVQLNKKLGRSYHSNGRFRRASAFHLNNPIMHSVHAPETSPIAEIRPRRNRRKSRLSRSSPVQSLSKKSKRRSWEKNNAAYVIRRRHKQTAIGAFLLRRNLTPTTVARLLSRKRTAVTHRRRTSWSWWVSTFWRGRDGSLTAFRRVFKTARTESIGRTKRSARRPLFGLSNRWRCLRAGDAADAWRRAEQLGGRRTPETSVRLRFNLFDR